MNHSYSLYLSISHTHTPAHICLFFLLSEQTFESSDMQSASLFLPSVLSVQGKRRISRHGDDLLSLSLSLRPLYPWGTLRGSMSWNSSILLHLHHTKDRRKCLCQFFFHIPETVELNKWVFCFKLETCLLCSLFQMVQLLPRDPAHTVTHSSSINCTQYVLLLLYVQCSSQTEFQNRIQVSLQLHWVMWLFRTLILRWTFFCFCLFPCTPLFLDLCTRMLLA